MVSVSKPLCTLCPCIISTRGCIIESNIIHCKRRIIEKRIPMFYYLCKPCSLNILQVSVVVAGPLALYHQIYCHLIMYVMIYVGFRVYLSQDLLSSGFTFFHDLLFSGFTPLRIYYSCKRGDWRPYLRATLVVILR